MDIMHTVSPPRSYSESESPGAGQKRPTESIHSSIEAIRALFFSLYSLESVICEGCSLPPPLAEGEGAAV